MLMRLKSFLYKIFPPRIIRVPTGISVVTYKKDRKNILSVVKVGENGKEWQKNYLVEHLLNENLEVTEQTLDEEKHRFVEPIRV